MSPSFIIGDLQDTSVGTTDIRCSDPPANYSYVQWLDQLAVALHPLPDKPEETGEASLRALWHCAAGQPVSVQAACEIALPALDAQAQLRLSELIAMRAGGVPLAHLTGRQRFLGLDFLVGKEALIPRRETELLGRAVLELLGRIDTPAPVVVDVCTGCGNLALAVAHAFAHVQVFASDLSDEAVALARRNAELLGLEARVKLRAGDLLTPFDSPEFHSGVDLLICNPPYISSAKVDTMEVEIIGFEPRMAFDGGPLGVRILQRLIREAPRFLRSGAWLACEVGLGQGPAVKQRLIQSGAYVEVRPVEDAAGQIRALLARRS